MKSKYQIAINPRFAARGMGPLARAVATHGLPDACEIIHGGRNIAAKLENAGLVIKAYRVPGFFKAIYYGWFGRAKSSRAYFNALKLAEMGIPTPEPAFAVEEYNRLGMLRRSYYACTYMQDWDTLHGVEQRPDFRILAQALAEFIFRLHSHGVLMMDMGPGNVLFHKNGENFEFCLVDINRMRFDVDDWSDLHLNFDHLLDSEEGVIVVARCYIDVMQRNNIHFDTEDFEQQIRLAYRRFFTNRHRRHFLKKLLRIR